MASAGAPMPGAQRFFICKVVSTMSTNWIIITDVNCVPDLKGPFPDSMLKQYLREALEERMGSRIAVATIHDGSLSVQDGPECLQMMDGRSAPLARRHRASTRVIQQERKTP